MFGLKNVCPVVVGFLGVQGAVTQSKTLCWMTDIEFTPNELLKWENLPKTPWQDCDLLLLTGDISRGNNTIASLEFLSKKVGEVFFTLGSQDYYGKSIKTFPREVETALSHRGNVHYLSSISMPEIHLKKGVSLIGIDSWYFPRGMHFFLDDLFAIEELKDLSEEEIQEFFKKRTWRDEKVLQKKLDRAFVFGDVVYLSMHIPPYSPEDYYGEEEKESLLAPFLSNPQLGHFLDKYMGQKTSKKLIVLSGHAGMPTVYKKGNIEVRIGEPFFKGSHIEKIALAEAKTLRGPDTLEKG